MVKQIGFPIHFISVAHCCLLMLMTFSANVSDSGIRDPYVALARAEDQHINAYKELLHHQLSNVQVCVVLIMSKRCRTSIIVLLRHVMILPESIYLPIGSTPGRSDWQAGMIMMKNTTN